MYQNYDKWRPHCRCWHISKGKKSVILSTHQTNLQCDLIAWFLKLSQVLSQKWTYKNSIVLSFYFISFFIRVVPIQKELPGTDFRRILSEIPIELINLRRKKIILVFIRQAMFNLQIHLIYNKIIELGPSNNKSIILFASDYLVLYVIQTSLFTYSRDKDYAIVDTY